MLFLLFNFDTIRFATTILFPQAIVKGAGEGTRRSNKLILNLRATYC